LSERHGDAADDAPKSTERRQIADACAALWNSRNVDACLSENVLGELAVLTGDTIAARRHFTESIALCERTAARPFLALSRTALARRDASEAPLG
jgi:hypothetical protein